MAIHCFAGINLKNKAGEKLEDLFNDSIKGKDPSMHREIGTKIALEYHKELFEEAEKYKEELFNEAKKSKKELQGKVFPRTPYVSPDKSQRVKEITDEYAEKIKNVAVGNNKKPQPEIRQEAGEKLIIGRISIAPIEGKVPKNLSDILADVSKGLRQKLFFIKPDKSRAIGTYSPGNTAIKLRNSNDLDTASHELGHAIDDKYQFVKNADKIVKDELLKFSPYGSTAPKGHPDPKSYELAEGLAEFLRAYTVNPEATKATAPNTFELYEKIIGKKFVPAELSDEETEKLVIAEIEKLDL